MLFWSWGRLFEDWKGLDKSCFSYNEGFLPSIQESWVVVSRDEAIFSRGFSHFWCSQWFYMVGTS